MLLKSVTNRYLSLSFGTKMQGWICVGMTPIVSGLTSTPHSSISSNKLARIFNFSVEYDGILGFIEGGGLPDSVIEQLTFP